MAEDIERAKEEALKKASKYIAGCLTTPDTLDKVDQIRRKVNRNKAAVDSRLKTAVQSQIDGIRSGLQELDSSQEDISFIRKLVKEVSEILQECEPLKNKIIPVEIAHEKHQKLSKTFAHLKLIFNVPETIKNTDKLIKDGKLLQAHKNIMELESTRDDLLFEVYLLAQEEESREPITDSPIYQYFRQVENLVNDLQKQLGTIIDRTREAAQNNPTELVTALRIIQREERSDNRCIETEAKSGFMPPGRPKSWKSFCIGGIRKSIDLRFDSNQLELSDKTDKMWLVKHLERMRLLIVDDLILVKHCCLPCFPPEWEIFNQYLLCYHEATSRTLEQFALTKNEDRPNECVSILNWINEYDGPDVLGHPELKDTYEKYKHTLEPVLSQGVIERLMDTYVNTTEKNMTNWLENMIETESQDWYQPKLPETDAEGFFQTTLPIILFQMLDQNLQVGQFIKKHVRLKILDISIRALVGFTRKCRAAIIGYKSRCYENRGSHEFFEPYMVAISNNCLMIADFAEQMKNQMRGEIGDEIFGEERSKEFKKMIHGYVQLSKEVCDMLLQGVFVDVESYLNNLLTVKWLGSHEVIDTFIATMQDYGNDYTHLRTSAYQYIMEKAQEKIIVEYVQAILSRRITFREFEERRDGANQILEEGKKIAEAFNRLAGLPEFEESRCAVLASIAEVLRLKSTDIVSLEVSGLANKYKHFRADHAMALLAVRGDMGRTDCLQLISDLGIREVDESSEEEKMKSIFGRITPAGSMLESLNSRLKTTNR